MLLFYMKIKDMPRQNRPRERFVSVGVGALSDADEEAIKKLDNYEGVPTNYYRKKLNISLKSEDLTCEIYIALETHDGLKPTKSYLNHLLNGKIYLGEEYYNNLKNTETLD